MFERNKVSSRLDMRIEGDIFPQCYQLPLTLLSSVYGGFWTTISNMLISAVL